MEFVSFEIAKKLTEKGFDWETNDVYKRNILACRYEDYPKPTISQVLKWLREEKKIYVALDFFRLNGNIEIWWTYSIRYIEDDSTSFEICKQKSYEQAALEGIKHVLDNLI